MTAYHVDASSVLPASGKKAAPKAPPRRRPAGRTTTTTYTTTNSGPNQHPKPVQQVAEESTNEPAASDRGSPVTIPEKAPQAVSVRNEPPNASPATQDPPTIEPPPSEIAASRTKSIPRRKMAPRDDAPAASNDTVTGAARETTPPPMASIEAETPAQPESPRTAKRARADENATAEPRTRKAPKRNSSRSNATVQAQVENDTVPDPRQTPRRPPVGSYDGHWPGISWTTRPWPDASGAETQPDGEVDSTKKAPAKRKVRKVKTPARVNEEDPQQGDGAQDPAQKAKKPRKPRQKRAAPKAKPQPANEGGENGEGASADGATLARRGTRI
ncbi:hypothetical protein L1887_63301 [Cichorium endivia]|nr:hypothetical protein L1887_63301 [Cichorium endivia]